jgi:hypothetical protein
MIMNATHAQTYVEASMRSISCKNQCLTKGTINCVPIPLYVLSKLTLKYLFRGNK